MPTRTGLVELGPNATQPRCFAWVLRLCVSIAATGMALTAAAQPATEEPDDAATWAPHVAEVITHDWLKLRTGEWLKGKVKDIQDETVYFDSAHLDDLEIDWDDVSELRMPKPHTFRFVNRRAVVGVGELRGNLISIRVGDEVLQFQRKDLISMIPGTGRELDYWSLSAGIGLSGQAGNTDQLSFSTTAELTRETVTTRGSLSYSGNIATQSRALSASNHRASAILDVYLTRRLYLIVPNIGVFQDEFQNIAMRITPALGAGCDIIRSKKITWQVELAMAYQSIQYVSVDSGSDSDSDAAVQFTTNLEIDLPKRFDWTTTYQPQIVVTDVGKTSQHLSSTLSFDFWGPLDFDTTFQWDWVAEPVADAGGQAPKANDFRISVGLSVDL